MSQAPIDGSVKFHVQVPHRLRTNALEQKTRDLIQKTAVDFGVKVDVSETQARCLESPLYFDGTFTGTLMAAEQAKKAVELFSFKMRERAVGPQPRPTCW